MTATDNPLTIRPAVADDLPEIAEVFLAARSAAVPAMPPSIHPPHEVHAFYAGIDLVASEREPWVAEDGRGIVGFVEVVRDWLDALYVLPTAQGEGIGSTLLDLVKSLRPDGFALWVFETNAPARAFYASHGLVEVERTDGSGNEERAPDIRMEWDPAEADG
ncbi:GNAT family N-acetyltransferase [Nocardioides stalactiti]|uniref:GNAT family N-acetyltransferase n=1 Tax=Nocardioides stalactiti TaxID=2755356 RepID=UPI001C8160BD|nr:GNAT family N-acetyltransferase [Nocardioides stalactiti]